MPAALHDDAVAWLQMKGAPMTAYNLNSAMNFLAENESQRPSYMNGGAGQEIKQGIYEQPLAAIERSIDKTERPTGNAGKLAKGTSDEQINADQRDAIARDKASRTNQPASNARNATPAGGNTPSAGAASASEPPAKAGEGTAQPSQDGAGTAEDGRGAGIPLLNDFMNTGVGRALANTFTLENLLKAAGGARVVGALGPVASAMRARVEPTLAARGPARAPDVIYAGPPAPQGALPAPAATAQAPQQLLLANNGRTSEMLNSPLVQQLLAKLGKGTSRTMEAGGGMRVPATSRVNPGSPGLNAQRYRTEVNNSIGLE